MWTLAYLDAGSGSMIASVVAGGAAGAAVMVKLAGRKVRDTMSFRKRGADDATAPDAPADPGTAEDAADTGPEAEMAEVEVSDADASAEVPRTHG
ncbi:MAG TPA: hypothetical protein VK866_06785 [Acidimicrobiales bacterium]|nr:hypothetical protein [Acidimicrobiales bacterium]